MHRSHGLQGSLKRRYKHPSPTSINGYHTAKKLLSQSPAKRPTFAFTSESEYTLGFLRKIAHNGTHAETGAFRTGPLSLPSERSARSQTSPGRVSERRTLPLLGLGRRRSRRTQRACGAAMRLRASLLRGVAAPLGCATLPLLLRLALKGHLRRWRRPPRTRTRPGPCGYRCGCRPAFCGDWRRYSPRPSGYPRCPGPTRRKTDPPWKA